LPLIYTLQQVSAGERRSIIKTIKHASDNRRKVADVVSTVHRCGGVKYATEVMLKLRDEAIELASQLPQNPAQTSLIDLIRFVTERRK
jgi:octaprenyl-diphosphate synthase